MRCAKMGGYHLQPCAQRGRMTVTQLKPLTALTENGPLMQVGIVESFGFDSGSVPRSNPSVSLLVVVLIFPRRGQAVIRRAPLPQSSITLRLLSSERLLARPLVQASI